MNGVKDSSLTIPLIGVSYSYQIPGGDLASRFGNNSNIGVGFLIKTKKNWILGAQGAFIFGPNVKENVLKNISTVEEGAVIDKNGQFANVRISEKGFTATLSGGKLFPLGGNPNSGLMLIANVGLLQHKIRIESVGSNAPQLDANYKKGYDRLSNGAAFSEFIGYLFLSNNRLMNFFGGFEFTQAFTQNRRSFDFDLMRKDNTKRTDLLYGIRAGWIMPLYKRNPEAVYYY